MKVSLLIPPVVEKVAFKYTSVKFVPNAAGCYVLTTFDHDVLYIGLTNSLQRRLENHLEDKEKTAVTELGKAFWFYYLFYDEANLEMLERTWQNQYMIEHSRLPILNSISSPLR